MKTLIILINFLFLLSCTSVENFDALRFHGSWNCEYYTELENGLSITQTYMAHMDSHSMRASKDTMTIVHPINYLNEKITFSSLSDSKFRLTKETINISDITIQSLRIERDDTGQLNSIALQQLEQSLMEPVEVKYKFLNNSKIIYLFEDGITINSCSRI